MVHSNLTLEEFRNVCEADKGRKLQRQWFSFVVAALVMYRIEKIRDGFLTSSSKQPELGSFSKLYGESIEHFALQLDDLRDTAQKMRLPMPIEITATDVFKLCGPVTANSAVAT